MDSNCDVCSQELRSQSTQAANNCRQQQKVAENIDGPFDVLPGNIGITGPQPGSSSPVTTANPTNPQPTTNPDNGGGNGGCQVAKWGQCGGQGYTGCTSCASGSTCRAQNQWYSQCL
ncbi:hypothetical protein OQA88_11048 [Cercophora sp. LCS_1]